MAGTDVTGPRVEEVLARERSAKPRVALAALVAAILAVVAGVLPQAIYSNFPRVYVLDAVRDSAGQRIGAPGLRTAQVLFIDHHAFALLIVALATGIAALLLGYLLVFLVDATVDRGGTPPRMSRMLALVGSGATATSSVVLQIAIMISASNFASSSDHGTPAAHDALRGGVVVAASFVGFIGSLTLAGAFVLVAIGAMRVGLLTRFLGVLGAIVGALILIGPLSGSPTWIVQAIWLVLLATLLVGRFPRVPPPAWTSGEAMPWPTQQEMREERERQQGGGGGGGRSRGGRGGGGLFGGGGSRGPAPELDPGPEPDGGSSAPAPSPATSARKKRKRRN